MRSRIPAALVLGAAAALGGGFSFGYDGTPKYVRDVFDNMAIDRAERRRQQKRQRNLKALESTK